MNQSQRITNEYLYFEGRDIKMTLWEEIDEGLMDRNVYALGGVHSKTLSSVVSKILNYIMKQVLEEIKHNTKYTDVHANDVLWVVTLPALWREPEKQFMRNCAYLAGLITTPQCCNLYLALEPECAALAAQSKEVDMLVEGDKFLTLDCGGGTVDICCMRVTRNDESGLKLAQLLAPRGGDWGSEQIDKLFQTFLKKFIGEEVFDEFLFTNPRSVMQTMMAWEVLKTGLKTKDFKAETKKGLDLRHILVQAKLDLTALCKHYNAEHVIPLYDSKKLARKHLLSPKTLLIQVQNPTVVLLPSSLLLSFFEPVIRPIEEHVCGLMEKPEMEG